MASGFILGITKSLKLKPLGLQNGFGFGIERIDRYMNRINNT